MAQPYIGEIRLVGFNFAPVGWAICNGETMAISQNPALFNLIGTTYGGNGQSTFNLPDLQGRVALHQGAGFTLGQVAGTEQVTLTTQSLPGHTHTFQVDASIGTTNTPAGHYLAATPLAFGNAFVPATSPAEMGAATTATGSSEPHDNMQPYLVLNYIISLFGIYPSQG